MPRITVKGADQLRREHPREFSLLFELGGSTDGIDTQVLSVGAAVSHWCFDLLLGSYIHWVLQALLEGAKTYGDAQAVKELVDGAGRYSSGQLLILACACTFCVCMLQL